jgi:hypothetical protein
MDIPYDKEPLLVFVRALTDRLAGRAPSGDAAPLDKLLPQKRERSQSEASNEMSGTYADEVSASPAANNRLPPPTRPSLLFDEEDEEEPPMVTVPVQSAQTSRAITPADRVAATLRNPFTCELLSKSTAKGFYESRYADVSLATMGCTPMFADGIPGSKALKSKIGQQCVYLRLGTSLVITGVIIEVMERMCQVSPDRGQNVSVEWVDAVRLYLVPENLAEVRKETRELIVRLLSDAVTEQR